MTRALLSPLLTVFVLVGCASGPRFVDRPIVWRVDDTRDIPEPDERDYQPIAYFADVLVFRRATRALELPDPDPAENVNALDEVPDSSWFTNRLSVRSLSPVEVARGAVTVGPPVPPYTVVAAKSGGGNPGFTIEDANGHRFIVKFDPLENPEMQTAASVIVNRILWAAGYNVPEDTIFDLARGDLRIGEGATYEDDVGSDEPITDAWIDEVIERVPRRPDGRIRASASLFLSGTPIGGFSAEGTRGDDDNDVIDHEDRRELRGLRVFAAWLNHTDMKEDNTLDMFVEEDGRHFVRHYLLDFGEALGGHAAEKRRDEDGYENVWDWERNTAAMFTFGLWVRPWEHARETPWPAIGSFSATAFDPEEWREAYPFAPFIEADDGDHYWGAKLVARFTRPMIEAIVAEARLSSPAAARYLVDTLMERRRRIGLSYLSHVSPLDWFTPRADSICGIDVAVWSGIATQGFVEHLPDDYEPDFDDGRISRGHDLRRVAVADDGTFCLPMRASGYTIARLRAWRGHEVLPVMQVHYIADERPRVIGIVRDE
jgi:hypothetical protein